MSTSDAISIRRARAADATILAAMRVASYRERHPEEDAATIERFAATCEAFFASELGAERSFLRAWIAWGTSGHDRPLGTATLSVTPTLPRPGDRGPFLDARVRNVYVEPFARRLGVARALMLDLMSDVADHHIRRLTLGSSAMGRPLYESLGFVAKGDEMVLDLGTD